MQGDALRATSSSTHVLPYVADPGVGSELGALACTVFEAQCCSNHRRAHVRANKLCGLRLSISLQDGKEKWWPWLCVLHMKVGAMVIVSH